MPSRKFALEPAGPDRLELKWSFNWKNMQVMVDGATIGTIPDAAALKEGRDFRVEIAGQTRTLSVKLEQSFANVALQVSLDDEPVPGSAGDPKAQVKQAAGVIYFVGGLSLIAGLAGMALNIEFLQQLGLGIEAAIGGVIYLGLAFLVDKKLSSIALGIAFTFFALDGVFSIVTMMELSGRPPIGGLIFRGFMLLYMYRGFGAIKLAKAEAATAPLPSTGVGSAPRDRNNPFDPPSR